MGDEKRLLLVDSDDIVRRALADQLVGQGFRLAQAGAIATAVQVARLESPDLVLTANALNDGEAAGLCHKLRDLGIDCPVIILGTPDQAGLIEAGASECLAKPFRLSALVECVQTCLRRSGQAGEPDINFGAYTFLPGAREVVGADQRRIRLTEKEAAILSYLHQAGGRQVSRDELLDAVWGYAVDATTHTVETHIYRLRRKLEEDGGARVLLTEAAGYRLAEPEI